MFVFVVFGDMGLAGDFWVQAWCGHGVTVFLTAFPLFSGVVCNALYGFWKKQGELIYIHLKAAGMSRANGICFKTKELDGQYRP
ncbi:hypothetical protein HNR65_000490 [Desulfosalsimonas propionicica]|uniref:Uncharacterized protein n=1 Tax=Desulfosalsimonas propionicica TaxID=332175 RepID=A0A7W0C6P1_9BACT|nr:hypothetical protein [Desulfosalsimonas propionicica]MBA2880183.1 hypothetical protein [Desulfosalsimonas propionicica]